MPELRIETPRLLIRPFTLDDAEAIHRVFGDPVAMQYVGGGVIESVERTRKRLERLIAFQRDYGYSYWAVVEKTLGEVIGDCGLVPFEEKGPGVELGYDIRRDLWNRGYATEAAQACLDYGYNVLQLPDIAALFFPDNIASRRVLEKIGMTERGRGRYYNHDLVLFAIENPRGSA